jgi:hypothetical protein
MRTTRIHEYPVSGYYAKMQLIPTSPAHTPKSKKLCHVPMRILMTAVGGST